MTCRHCVAAGRVFGQRHARRDLKRLRRKGPSRSTGLLIEAIREEGVQGARVLDIGAGVGALHLSLLDAGAHQATHVDASAAYQEAARREAESRGLRGRVTYVEGDYLDVSDQVPTADVVCLDRVVCCYPDMGALVRRSAAAAERVYGLVLPVDRWWTRALTSMANVGLRLIRSSFRTFVHPGAEVREAVESQGLGLVYSARTGMWQAMVFARASVSQVRSSDRSSV